MGWRNPLDNIGRYKTDLQKAASDRTLKWGGNVDVAFGVGANPNIGLFELVNIPSLWDRPVLFTIDMEIVVVSGGGTPGMPPANLYGGAFSVLFGAGNDMREHFMLPGIQSVLGESLRIRLRPPLTLLFSGVYNFRAHCTVQEGVSPSYTWGP